MSEHASGAQLSYGWSLGPQARMLFLIGILFSAFQIITASFSPLSSTIVRAVHVGFLMLMTFGIAAAVRPRFDAVAALLWLVYRRGALHHPGRVLGVFLAGYGAARFIVEFFRQPDAQFVTPGNPLGLAIELNGWGLTMGQLLSLPMIALGLWFVIRSRARTAQA